MKKLFSVIMVVVLVFGLSVPVSAVQYRSDLYNSVNTYANLAVKNWKASDSTYSYRLVFYNPSDSRLHMFFSDSSVLNKNSSFYSLNNTVSYPAGFNSGVASSKFTVSDSSVSSGSLAYSGLTNLGLPITNVPIGLYLPEYSTATFYNMEELDAIGNVITYLIDTSSLKSLLAQAGLLKEKDYSIVSWSALQTAVTDANALLAGGSYTQDTVNAMCTRLQSAMNGLSLIPVLPDATPLRVVLAEAKAIDNIGYSVPTWTRLRTAIYEGDELLTRPTYTAPQIATATTNVRTGIDGLELYVAPEPENHRYMVDGFRVIDLLPAQDAIMANFKQARKFGIFAFAAIILIRIITRLIRKIVDVEFAGDTTKYEREADFGHYHSNFKQKGTKYIDY